MISIILKSPQDIAQLIASRIKAKRLAQNLSQQSLSERSGVSYSVIKKFERTGQISFESLLKLSLSLGSIGEFENLFASVEPEKIGSLDELIKDTNRKRGRK